MDSTFKNEDSYRDRIALCLNSFGIETQVHNDSGYAGVPDLSFAGKGADGWIEVKYMPGGIPSRIPEIKHFTSDQRNWLNAMGTTGSGFCYLWIGSPGRHVFINWKHLLDPEFDPESLTNYSSVEHAAVGFRKMLESCRL